MIARRDDAIEGGVKVKDADPTLFELSGMGTLTYVSRSLIASDGQDEVIEAMLTEARSRNSASHISGALLFTGIHFVQTLEGRLDDIDALMDRIAGDARHSVLHVVERREVPLRSFAGWSMAYSGRSHFVETSVVRALAPAPAGRPHDTRRLVRLVRDFSLMPSGPATS